MTDMIPLDLYRRVFAEEVAAVANLQTPGLVDAIAAVPRERFLGDGPWKIFRTDGMPGASGRYESTSGADPRHVYHNVLVALDADRNINNGQPSLVTSWIDQLALGRGSHVVHIGCGTGYYSAIIASLVGSSGTVTAIEADATLATRARDALAQWPTVQVVCGDGAHTTFTDVDAILVNAGVTMIPSAWIDALTERGRMLMPLTFSPTPDSVGTGVAVVLTRASDHWDARIIGVTQIYPCTSARDASGNAAIQKAMMKGRWRDVRTLRRDRHDPADNCWCHLESGCLSYVTG